MEHTNHKRSFKMTGRPQITIHETGNELSAYDANHISIMLNGSGKYALFFQCSGSMMQIPIDRVSKIEFIQEGCTYCPYCDQPLPIGTMTQDIKG
jgi:hypothetical protein